MESGFARLVISFLPFLVLIAVWIFFMRKMGASGAWKLVMEEQGVIQKDIARQLDRIATALEQRKP